MCLCTRKICHAIEIYAKSQSAMMVNYLIFLFYFNRVYLDNYNFFVLFLFKIDYEDDMSQSFDDKYSYAVSPGTSKTTS